VALDAGVGLAEHGVVGRVAEQHVGLEQVLEERVEAGAEPAEQPQPLARLHVDHVAQQAGLGVAQAPQHAARTEGLGSGAQSQAPAAPVAAPGQVLVDRVVKQARQNTEFQQETAGAGGARLIHGARHDASPQVHLNFTRTQK